MTTKHNALPLPDAKTGAQLIAELDKLVNSLRFTRDTVARKTDARRRAPADPAALAAADDMLREVRDELGLMIGRVRAERYLNMRRKP